MADKADWCDANVRYFIDICKGEIEAGNRPFGFFNRTGWKNVIFKHEEKTGQKLTKKQLKNKWDNMKKEYTWFMELKNSATGLGWNEAKRTVECCKEWWDEHLARCNNPDKGIKCNHVRFRKQGPKHLDDLHILFDKIHVSGASASYPGDISSDESSDDDVSEIQKTQDIDDVKLAALKKSKLRKKKCKEHSSSIEEKGEKSPFFQLYKNTCLKIETAADKISSSVEASSAPPTNPVPSISEAMKMVKDCGV
nr:L10-interacting MYB domain-containing protein-like [Setaria viridis]